MILQSFKRRRKSSILLMFTFFSFIRHAYAEENYSNPDDGLSSNFASTSNCFGLVDHGSWHRVLTLEKERGILRVHLDHLGPNAISCLQARLTDSSDASYSISVWRENIHEQKYEEKFFRVENLAHMDANKNKENASRTDPAFGYILLQGLYRVKFKPCSSKNKSLSSEWSIGDDDVVCDMSNIVTSEALRVEQTSSIVSNDNWCVTSESGQHEVDGHRPSLEAKSVVFRFRYRPCFSGGDLGEKVTVTLHSVHQDSYNGSSASCFASGKVLKLTLNTSSQFDVDTSSPMSEVYFKTPDLSGDHYYCLDVTSDHVVCRNLELPEELLIDGENHEKPSFCQFQSEIIHVPTRPWIGDFIPFCSTHFACGWVYIVIILVAVLVLSCLMSAICVLCCCKKKQSRYKTHHHIPVDDQHTFDTLCLSDIKPKKTWVEIHEEFYREPPKNPGKILLLYSPDSKLFKDLQHTFRSFLELACHCVVLDLFDEELFQNIAYDPEAWLSNLLQDDKFKIIVICSENAFKRQQALVKGEVLNIPDVNSSLDGLFSAGLKFIQEQHAYDYRRLALVRYEMLALTAPEFKLQDMVPNREFLVPTQLHDLFCWIHDHDPLDLLGKPWDRYHLELQFLQDALKQARLDRRH